VSRQQNEFVHLLQPDEPEDAERVVLNIDEAGRQHGQRSTQAELQDECLSYCGAMLAIRTTLPHFSDSAAMKAANSWALSGIGTVPRSASRASIPRGARRWRPPPSDQAPVRDECSDADDRVVDMLWKLVANRLADLYVGLADKIIGGREPAEVGHGLQVADDDAWFHAGRSVAQRLGVKKDVP
jgi:hypothetical protein